MKYAISVLLLLSFFLSGCEKSAEVAVVSQISVVQEKDGCRRIYTDTQKMQRVLNGLRQLGQRYRPEADPAVLDVPETYITLEFSDGSYSYYCLKGDRYIRENHCSWQQTDPTRLCRLQFLILALPGDKILPGEADGSYTDSSPLSGQIHSKLSSVIPKYPEGARCPLPIHRSIQALWELP